MMFHQQPNGGLQDVSQQQHSKWRVIKTSKYTPQRPSNKNQESLIAGKQHLMPQKQRSFTAKSGIFMNSLDQGALRGYDNQAQLQMDLPHFAKNVTQVSRSLQPVTQESVGYNEERRLFLESQMTFMNQNDGSHLHHHYVPHDHHFPQQQHEAYRMQNRNSSGSPQRHQEYASNIFHSQPHPDDQEHFLSGSEEDQDDDYHNKALLDFPSDTDIVSYEQTPNRQNEHPFSSSISNPLSGGAVPSGYSPGRSPYEQPSNGSGVFQYQPSKGVKGHSSLFAQKQSIDAQLSYKTQSQELGRAPLTRLNSLLSAFQKKLASGQNSQATSSQAADQKQVKEVKSAQLDKVQLTEPTSGKRDEDPFGKLAGTQRPVIKSNNLIFSEDRVGEASSPYLGPLLNAHQGLVTKQYHHFRTPPPGQSKKQNLLKIEKSRDVSQGPALMPKFNRQQSYELPQMHLPAENPLGQQRSPHFFDDAEGPSQITRNEQDLLTRKYSVYRRARDAMSPSPALLTMHPKRLLENASKTATMNLNGGSAQAKNASARQSLSMQSHGRDKSHISQSNRQAEAALQEVIILRHTIDLLNDQNCNLKAELTCSQYVCQALMRKNRELKQAMLLQSEMLHQKDFVACKLAQVATENYELKLQNSKLWNVVERQRDVFSRAQQEIDDDRLESERLLEELATENERLREILKISDAYQSIDVQDELQKRIRDSEVVGAQLKQDGQNDAGPNVREMVNQASAVIKKQAADRKLEKERAQQELNEMNQSSATPVNGKRTIQPKKAFLLALGSDETTSDDEEEDVPPGETPEEKAARKEAARVKREQLLLMDQMDGVLLSSSRSNSSEKKTTIFNLDSAF